MPYRVIPSKIIRPEAEDVLIRLKLFNRFDKMKDRAMLWVTSPAGAGKTTSVNSYIAARRLNCVWYRIDAGDADLATFFYFLGQAVTHSIQDDSTEALPLFTPEFLQDVPEFSCNFFDRLSQQFTLPTVLVFDNIHHIPTDALLHKAVIAGLNRLPRRLQVIMISRNPPPASYSRLRANSQIGQIGWQDLRLSTEECAAMIRLRLAGERLSRKQMTSIHSLTKGWAAGVQLLLMTMQNHGSPDIILPEKMPEDIVNYFAEEIYSQLDPSMRHFLLHSAFLPWITRQIAETLIDSGGDGSHLDYLIHNNLFIETSSSKHLTFRYHPLFRKFLLMCATVEYDPATIRNIQLQNARCLLGNGFPDEGAKLLVQAGGWQQLADLIVQEAPLLFRQGRSGIIQTWLTHLPEALLHKNPMLLYWQGVCCFPSDFELGREYLQQAYAGFRQSEDPTGLYLSCIAIMESLCREIRPRPLLHWIKELNNLLTEHPKMYSGWVESQVIKVMLPGYLFAQPLDPALHTWAAKAEAFLVGDVDLSFEMEISAYLVLYYGAIGVMEKMHALQLRLRSLPDSSEILPLSRLVMLNMQALCSWYLCDYQASHLATEEGLSLAAASGIKDFRIRFLLQGVYTHIAQGDISGADSLLKEIGSCVSPNNFFSTGLFYYLSAMAAAGKGKLDDALFLNSEAIRLTTEFHVPFITACCHVGRGQILSDLGNYTEAAIHLQEARSFGEAMHSPAFDHLCLIYESYLAFVGQEHEKGYDLLTRGFAMGRQQGFMQTGWWVTHAMALLCIRALEAGIEPEYARALITKHRLAPSTPPVTVEAWPWPIRIYTLGRFELVLDDKPFRPRKAPEKPVALLKALLALGGRQVPDMNLAELLWPDSDGDLQYQTLKTTLHRLRTMLGVKNVIKHADRMVTLDPGHCWVDGWAFERLIDEADRRQNAGETRTAMKLFDRACRYYQGGFLNGLDHPYALAARRRLRWKFIRSAEMLGRYLENGHRIDEAVRLYEKILHQIPAEEKIYQRLITCHLKEERRAEAAEVYKRCHQVLADELGVAPSNATTALYKKKIPG